jgi:hypothetical protein
MHRVKTLKLATVVAGAVFLGLAANGCGGSGGSGTPTAQNTLSIGLTHWWKLAGNGSDSVGALSSTPIGPVTYAAAPSGQGMVFNGTTTGISLPPATDMQFQASFTLSAWAKLTSYPTVGQIWATIIFDGDDRPGLDPYSLQVDPNGGLIFLTTSSAQAVGLYAPDPFPLKTWVFVTATYDKSTGDQALYENGVVVAENFGVKDLTPVCPLVSNEHAGVGIGTSSGFPNSIYNMGWNGEISDLKVYDRALSSSEAMQLFLQDGGQASSAKLSRRPL